MKNKIVKKAKSAKKYPTKTSDVLVTQSMLFMVRDELKEHVKSEIHGVKAEIHDMKSDIHAMKSDIHDIRSEVYGLRALIEEQNARNAVVLDGLTSLFGRQDRVEKEVSSFRKDLTELKASSS